jgi:PKD repeat protein
MVVNLEATSSQQYAPAVVTVSGRVVGSFDMAPVDVWVRFGDDGEEKVEPEGNGNFSVDHSYQGPGTFTVVVEAGNAADQTATATTSVEVHPPLGAITVTADPCADANTCGPDTFAAALGRPVALRADVTGGVGALRFRWDFDDGTVPSWGQTVSHQFREARDHPVTVTAMDSITSVSSTVLVVRGVDVTPVQVLAETSGAAGPAPLAAQLTVYAMGIPPLGIVVNWGDVSTSTLAGHPGGGTPTTISHVYQSAGTYTATVTVSDRLGRTASDTQVFTVR